MTQRLTGNHVPEMKLLIPARFSWIVSIVKAWGITKEETYHVYPESVGNYEGGNPASRESSEIYYANRGRYIEDTSRHEDV